jgi:hypothetical protein
LQNRVTAQSTKLLERLPNINLANISNLAGTYAGRLHDYGGRVRDMSDQLRDRL